MKGNNETLAEKWAREDRAIVRVWAGVLVVIVAVAICALAKG